MYIIRNFIISLIILSVLGSALVMPIVYLDFNLRKEYITEILCINRDKPVTVCGGKCYLDLQLEKAARQQDNESNTPGRLLEISFFLQECTSVGLSNSASEAKITYHLFSEFLLPSSFCHEIFHPPKLNHLST